MKLASTLYQALVTSRNKTVTEVARELKMSRPAFSNVVNGNTSLSVELALKIERQFGLQARTLLIRQLDEQLSAARETICPFCNHHHEAVTARDEGDVTLCFGCGRFCVFAGDAYGGLRKPNKKEQSGFAHDDRLQQLLAAWQLVKRQ